MPCHRSQNRDAEHTVHGIQDEPTGNTDKGDRGEVDGYSPFAEKTHQHGERGDIRGWTDQEKDQGCPWAHPLRRKAAAIGVEAVAQI